jgi:FdhD protein
VHPVEIVKVGAGGGVRKPDLVAEEEPLLIRMGYGAADGREERDLAVTMRTPGNDVELAAGFVLSEGVVRDRADLLSVRVCEREGAGNVVRVELAAGVKWDAARLARNFYASSSCGICGKASIEAVEVVCGMSKVPLGVRMEARLLRVLPGRLREAQGVFERTGGLHAAGVFGLGGELRCLREDVGRHNAVDKVLGYRLLSGEVAEGDFLVLSGRISFELVQKAVAGGFGMVAALGAPSGGAVRLAEAFGVTLVGFLREDGWNVYSGVERLDLSGL